MLSIYETIEQTQVVHRLVAAIVLFRCDAIVKSAIQARMVWMK